MTFRNLEPPARAMREDEAETNGELWPLQAWYACVRDTPIEALSVGDLAVAIRQRINLTYVIPIALRSLNIDPLDGDLVDGELILALKGLPMTYWLSHRDEAEQFLRLAQRGYKEALGRGADGAAAEDLRIDVADLLGIQVEKSASLTSEVRQLGQSRVVNSELRFVLKNDEMSRLAGLASDSARTLRGFDVLFGEILVHFAHGSSTGTASFIDYHTVIFRSNKRDLYRFSDSLREAVSRPARPQLLRMVPKYLIANADVKDMVFGTQDAFSAEMLLQ